MSLGLRNAGCDVVAAVEWDKDAAATYRAMLGDHMHETDITTFGSWQLPACDLLHASPPCQGFSYAGKRDKADPRNAYWRQVLRIVADLQPAWVTMENVRGMLTMGEDKAVITAFRKIGYTMTPHLLCAADYGVPQRRYRVFYVGNRLGLPNPVPPASHAQPPRHVMLGLQPWVTVRQALGIGGAGHPILDAPSATLRFQNGGHDVGRMDELGLTRPQGWVPTERTDHGTLDWDSPACAIKAGGNTDASGHMGGACPPSLPYVELDSPAPTIQGGGSDTGGAEPVRHRLPMTDQRNPSNGRSAYYDGSESPARSALTEPGNIADEFEYAPTIQADSLVSRPGHHGPGEPRMGLRRLTVRECAILQGFPDWFQFSGSKTSQYRQVGNAVPPAMGEAIARAIQAIEARQAA